MEEKKTLVIGLNKNKTNTSSNSNSNVVQTTLTTPDIITVTESSSETNNDIPVNNTTAAVGDEEIGLLSQSLSANNINNNNTHTFKTGITPQRPRALSPLNNKEKIKSVSFSENVINIDNSNVNNSSNENNENSNSNSDKNNIVNNSNSNSNSNSSNNGFISSKHVFNKLNTSGSNEIFQFDEEYEEEIENSSNSNNNNNISPQITSQEESNTGINNNNNNSDDEYDEVNQQRIVIGDNLRGRSNGLKQQQSRDEMKLGTSLPVIIPPRNLQTNHKGSLFESGANVTGTGIPESEKKKYVTPRQSWVEVFTEKDEVSNSFQVPSSLSRKPKSFV